MIAERVCRLLQTEYEKRLMVFDFENISSCVDYVSLLRTNDFSVYFYDDIERIRYKYETEMRYTKTPCAIIVTAHLYVPTDIRRNFCEIELSLTNLYPQMDANILKAHFQDIELIDFSYDEFEQRCLLKEETAHFLQNVTFGEQNVREFIAASEVKIAEKLKSDLVFSEWINIAKENARLEKYACLYSIQRDQSFIDEAFSSFVFSRYGKLSHAVSSEAPVMLRDVIGRIATGEKTALLVADGMSMFDFEVLSDYMTDYDYSFGATFALIPTITSISRQSLLSGKYPQQLESPFTLTKEESGFYAAAQEHGFDKKEIWYSRGYNKQPDVFTRFAAIIVSDIDDMVHGQKQGRLGMYQDVNLWAKEGKLLRLIDSLLQRGFKVYLTADHGNTLCTGGGGIKRTGVETETKSRRMIVLKDFADVSDELATRTFDYPGYYCNRKFQYRICKGRTSFDNKNEIVMTHGGISLEEVVVPFVEVRKKMAKMIGLSRAIKREWLDKTVDMVLEGMNPEDIKKALQEYISFELNSQDNIRKSSDILMNLWVHPFADEASNNIRIKALEAIRSGNTDRMAFHWCMLLLYYPVFVDVTGTIGKLSSMQDAFTLSWLKEKIYEQWGERTTMVHSLDKIMQTIRQLGAVNSKAGVYTVNHYFMTDEQTRIILMKTILALKIKPYYEPAELASLAQMFPFDYEASSDIVFGSQSFELGNFGGNPVVVG